MLQETWSGAAGSAGSSFNFFDPRADKWRQLRVWRDGTTLELAGTFAEGRMTLEGTSLDREGREGRNRITWYDNADGTVRQHRETAPAGGGSFTTVFDGLYRRSAGQGAVGRRKARAPGLPRAVVGARKPEGSAART